MNRPYYPDLKNKPSQGSKAPKKQKFLKALLN